jgi:hypothetical protein
MVIDTDGNERTDTEGILLDMVKGKCALCPMGGAGDELGGYKGYGWYVCSFRDLHPLRSGAGLPLSRFSAQLSNPENSVPCCLESIKRLASHAL